MTPIREKHVHTVYKFLIVLHFFPVQFSQNTLEKETYMHNSTGSGIGALGITFSVLD